MELYFTSHVCLHGEDRNSFKFTCNVRTGGTNMHAYICDLFRLIALSQDIILNNTTGLTNIQFQFNVSPIRSFIKHYVYITYYLYHLIL